MLTMWEGRVRSGEPVTYSIGGFESFIVRYVRKSSQCVPERLIACIRAELINMQNRHVYNISIFPGRLKKRTPEIP